MSTAIDENACDARCATSGQRFIYLDKHLLNTDALFGLMDGHHPYIRKFVLHSLHDKEKDAVYGHSSSVRVEMNAIGMQHKIEKHVTAFMKEHCQFKDAQSFVLLVQNTGYFPLAVFFTHETDRSIEIDEHEAKTLMNETVLNALILNL